MLYIADFNFIFYKAVWILEFVEGNKWTRAQTAPLADLGFRKSILLEFCILNTQLE